jgi:hypothetical protein
MRQLPGPCPAGESHEPKTLHQTQRPGYFDGLPSKKGRTGNVQLNRVAPEVGALRGDWGWGQGLVQSDFKPHARRVDLFDRALVANPIGFM